MARRLILVLAASICILMAGCEPDPELVARAVQATLTAAAPTPTPLVIKSILQADVTMPAGAGEAPGIHWSTPAVRSLETPAAPAAPAFRIPAGWVEYRDGVGGFSLRYPPSWTLTTQDSPLVGLKFPAGGSVSLAVQAFPFPGYPGDAEAIDGLAGSEVARHSSRSRVEVLSKGRWNQLVDGNYVELGVYGTLDTTAGHELIIEYVLDARHFAHVKVARLGGSLTRPELDTVALVMCSVELLDQSGRIVMVSPGGGPR